MTSPDSAIDPLEDHRWSDSRDRRWYSPWFYPIWNVGSDRSDRIPCGGFLDCVLARRSPIALRSSLMDKFTCLTADEFNKQVSEPGFPFVGDVDMVEKSVHIRYYNSMFC